MTQTHSAGAVRAAHKIYIARNEIDFAKIIDEETHAAEIFAFIEKIMDAKTKVSAELRIEAAELIKKAKGELVVECTHPPAIETLLRLNTHFEELNGHVYVYEDILRDEA